MTSRDILLLYEVLARIQELAPDSRQRDNSAAVPEWLHHCLQDETEHLNIASTLPTHQTPSLYAELCSQSQGQIALTTSARTLVIRPLAVISKARRRLDLTLLGRSEKEFRRHEAEHQN